MTRRPAVAGYPMPDSSLTHRWNEDMNSLYGNWRDHQNAVAAFFRECGCTVRIEAPVQGARAKHDIDVYVTFLQHGIE